MVPTSFFLAFKRNSVSKLTGNLFNAHGTVVIFSLIQLCRRFQAVNFIVSNRSNRLHNPVFNDVSQLYFLINVIIQPRILC
jgi:hypothetical protein